MGESERVRVDIGFEGGQVIGGNVDVASADALERALHEDGPRVVVLELEDGRYHVVVLARHVFPAFEPRLAASGSARASSGRARRWRRRRSRRSRRSTSASSSSAAQAGRARRARRAVPDPLRPDLQLPAHERRQPPRRRGPDDADVPEDARVDRPLPLAVGAVLGVALPHRAQPRDGSLPRAPPLAAGGGGARAAGLRGAVGRARGDAVDRAPVDARADREALAGAAAGADAEVRLQLPERRRREDPRQDRGRDQVAAAPRARVAAEADRQQKD